MKRFAPLVLFSGCYLGAHGSIDTTLRARPTSAASPQGTIDIGGGGGDETQAGAVLLGIGVSPLVGRNDDTAPPRQAQISFGGFYERAFTPAQPAIRWYARLLFGGSLCGSKGEQDMTDETCNSADKARTSSVLATAVGVAIGASAPPGDGDAGAFASVGLGLVYTYATDAVLGTGDFLGLELSFGGAADIITPLTKSHE